MTKSKIQNPKSKNAKPFAKKSFGQNFLIDQNYIDKIVAALNPQMGETVIEIGAGRGALTEKLIKSGASIIAIELDRDLTPLLYRKFGKYENFQLIEQDALKIDFAELLDYPKSEIPNPKKAKLVANLPYYISTAILQKIIEQRRVFSEMILMFQREVLERIAAKVGNSERGFLTVLVEAYLDTEKLFDVPPTAFQPSPKIQSAVMRLITKEGCEIEIKDEDLFREILSVGFVQKRKTILNNLKNAPLILKEKIRDFNKLFTAIGIEPNRRAETLTLEEWKRLFEYFYSN